MVFGSTENLIISISGSTITLTNGANIGGMASSTIWDYNLNVGSSYIKTLSKVKLLDSATQMVAVGTSEIYSPYNVHFSTFIFGTASPYQVTTAQKLQMTLSYFQIIELYILS